MLRLRNIKMNNGVISASYDPEDSGQIGAIIMEVSTAEIIESNLSEYDKDFPSYYRHAVSALIRLVNEKDIPDEKIVMWY